MANGYGRRLRLLRLLICWAAEELVIIAANGLIDQVALALGSIAAEALRSSAAGDLVYSATVALGPCMTEDLRPWIARQLRPLILVCSWTDKCFQKVTVRVGSQAVQ